MDFKRTALACAVLTAWLPAAGNAAVIGFLGNFDVINDTGYTAHGFEIELEGLHSSDITDTFGGPGRGFPDGRGFDPETAVQRYGAPTITEYSNGSLFGTRVTYMGLFDGTNWDYGTPSGTFITPGDNCWTGGGVGYGPGTPCDHFGVGTSKNPTSTKYNWLLAKDPANSPGVLSNGSVNLPAPVMNVVQQPPPAPGEPAPPPVVEALVVGNENEINPANFFGEALWVKVFTTELGDVVELEDLIGGEPAIEQAETEIEWQLVQFDPGNPDSPPSILEAGYGAPVGPNAASVIRRYEFYAYTGNAKDDNEADLIFGDSQPHCDPNNPSCSYKDPLLAAQFDPALVNELGHYLGAQNVAANLRAAPVPVPAALPLLASGLLASGWFARGPSRRRRKV
jgi:hypothetical protein